MIGLIQLGRLGVWALCLTAYCLCWLGCTRVVRSRFVESNPHAAQIAGWTIIPRIVSKPSVEFSAEEPPRPEWFAISLQAVRPRPSADSEHIADLLIDSVLMRRFPSDTAEMLLFRPGTWVSYPSLSPDTLVKRFSPTDADTRIWRRIPKTTSRLELTLFARWGEGRLGSQDRVGVVVPIDTIVVPGVDQYTREELAVLTVRTDQHFFQFGYHGWE